MESEVGFNSHKSASRKKSLLEKYDVPIHHLDFEYVKNCQNVKYLEKIVKILRSKEEGYYPELTECAVAQLSSLDSRNPLLRKETKVLTKADMSMVEWNNITSDMQEWKGSVDRKESRILEKKSQQSSYRHYPSIRSSKTGYLNETMQESENQKSQRISSLDFNSWDKFDAEEECKKLDLESDKKEEEKKKRANLPKCESKEVSVEELAIESLGEIGHLSQDEREELAIREKTIGNEFYNANKIEESIKHYTRSIHLHLTTHGLNNRAAAYLRQCAFNKALVDLNKVLEMDPKNIKARFRRAQSFQHKNLFREAMDDINEVLIQEPNQVVARHMADQLRESIAKLPKVHRIKVQDKQTGKTSIRTVTESEMLNDYKNEKFVEVNEWGLPKIMCNCNGKYSNEPGIRHEEHVRFQHLNKPPSTKPVTKNCNQVIAEAVEPVGIHSSSEVPKKLDIIEVERNLPSENNANFTTNVSMNDESKNSCIVADMRSSEMRKRSKSLKLDQNIAIQDSKNPTSLLSDASPNNNNIANNNNELFLGRIEDVKSGKSVAVQENYVGNSNAGDGDNVNRNVLTHSPTQAHWPCGCREQIDKFRFKKDWCQLSGPSSIEKKAELLKSVCPNHLVEAFGNSWDKDMMIDIFKCLLRHFGPGEQKRALEYLQVVPHLDRFNINVMFIAPDDKPVVQELIQTYANSVDSSFLRTLRL